MMMRPSERTTLVGVFDNRRQAEQCVEELHRMGFRDDQIGFMMQDSGGRSSNAATTVVDRDTDAGDVSTGEGIVTGGIVGGLIGAAAALFIPAVGPVLAGGILATTLAGAAIGAVTGGIAAALIDLGVPEEEAHYYESEFKSGRILVTVRADSRWDEVRAVMARYGAHFNESMAPGLTSTATTRSADFDRTRTTGDTIELREEQLQARKTPVETGEVSLHKEVVTENRTVEVPVKREEVYIERRPVDRPATDADLEKHADETISVPVMEEEVTVEKRPVVREEINIGKREIQDTERVTGQVRREEAHIERDGDVEVHGDTDTFERRDRKAS